MINPNSHIPVYEQIVEHIRGAVAAGVYRPDELLPSIRALSLELLVNPNTVQRAYQELERQGLVCMRKGLGIFVAKNGDVSAQSKSEVAVYSRLSQAVQGGITAGITPERMEELFQKALRNEAAKTSQTGENT